MHPSSRQTHGTAIMPVVAQAKKILEAKVASGSFQRLSKTEQAMFHHQLATTERTRVYNGVNISRIQIEAVLAARQDGCLIEFETIGPYVSDYLADGGVMTTNNLTPEDVTGLRLAGIFRRIFPNARLVSLYDDYNYENVHRNESLVTNKPTVFSRAAADSLRERFLDSFLNLLKHESALSPQAIDEKDYLCISERKKVKDVPLLIQRLHAKDFILEEHKAIWFVNENAENPLYRQIRLRSKDGRWSCVALDAATFLSPRNLQIVHVIILPEYMARQQDQVWEILRVLGFQPLKYHNMFFDPKYSADEVAKTVWALFNGGDRLMSDI